MLFFRQHNYFRHIWGSLDKQIREKKLELVTVGKDVIRYENIKTVFIQCLKIDTVFEKTVLQLVLQRTKTRKCVR